MVGGAYIVIALMFGIGTGMVWRSKGSSFFIWFLIGAVLPILGTVAALLYRYERDEPRRRCDECGQLMPMSQQVCRRCGADQEAPRELFVAG